MAQGLQQMAQGFQQMAQGSTKALDYEQLKALLPDIDGWTRSDTKGEQLSMPVSYSRGETRYQKDDARIELEITDTSMPLRSSTNGASSPIATSICAATAWETICYAKE